MYCVLFDFPIDKNTNKRGQKQTCLHFAEREVSKTKLKIQNKKERTEPAGVLFADLQFQTQNSDRSKHA
ncbi:MAG: hypothetical protein K2N04_02960, partial [Alistipes sp.]|nr:hypothetical protein [Alistipes sp.]